LAKKHVYEIAEELGKNNRDVITAAKDLGLKVENIKTIFEEDDVKKIVGKLGAGSAAAETPKAAGEEAAPKTLTKEEKIKRMIAKGNAVKLGGNGGAKPAPAAAKPAAAKKAAPAQGGSKPAPAAKPAAPLTREERAKRAAAALAATQEKVNAHIETVDASNKKAALTREEKAKKAAAKKIAEAKAAAAVPKPKAAPAAQGGKPGNNAPKANAPKGSEAEVAAKLAKKEEAAKERAKKFSNDARPGGGYNNYNNTRKKQADAAKNNPFAGGNKNRRRNKRDKKIKGSYNPSQVAATIRKDRDLPETLVYSLGMNVQDVAKRIYREPSEIIKKLFMEGIMVNQNQVLDKDTLEMIAMSYGIEPEEKVEVDIADIDRLFDIEDVNEENLVSRPPVVTIMGHVDHGKTTLLDTLRSSRVTSGEAGGITQHIGAYQLDVHGNTITFLDTPGHEAFTSMRARGASITDITILVVAADDGVMPQTVEAINHAKAAGVPIIVAVNKIDKPGANPDKVIQELSEHALIPESWGGDTPFVQISAKFNQNIDELLEMILLVAEVEELKADPDRLAIGTVIEARQDKGVGTIATVLVQQGTLKHGDPIVVGNTYGRVRALINDLGRRIKEAGPATPVEVLGLNDVPQAGDHFAVFEDEKSARAAGEERAKRALLEQRARKQHVTLSNLFDTLKDGEIKEVNVIIKADVQGSAEALSASLKKIDVDGVRVNIVHSAVGAINESDVTLADAAGAIVIGFNTRPTAQARIHAEQAEVDIRLHSIIYNAIDEIEEAMKGMLDPEFEEKITGEMLVRDLFVVSKVGTIAGCYVTNGYIERDSGVRLIRNGVVIYEGKLSSLKRFKDDVKEVKLGFECGAMIENYNDVKVDDVIEAFVMEEVKRK
jgi:translation initiation factor IF-2